MDIYLLAIVFSLIFIVVVIDMVRRNKLQEKYSIIWILFAGTLIVFSAFPNLINYLASLVGVYYAPALLLLLGVIFLMVYMLKITETISKQEKKIIKLLEEVALLKEEVNKQK